MKRILLIIVSSILLFNLSASTVLAFECSKVSTERKGFFTILEEPLITKDDPNDPNTRLCFRKCEAKVEDKRECEIVGIKDCKPEPGKITCKLIQVIRSESGADLIYTYVGMIYKWAAGTIGIIAVFTMVYSGIQIMMAGGDSGVIDEAKKRIMQSIFGLVVLFLSGLILYTINPTFFV